MEIMKTKGYYDLLLKLSDSINHNFQITHINDEQPHIKDFDHYLVKQVNNLLYEHLKTINKAEAKIAFLNQIISSFTNLQFSNNILLQVSPNYEEQTLYQKIFD